jgi:uncharacterized protein
MTTQTTMLTPTAERERLPLLDVLRGFSIFGILLNNMGMFSGPSREPGFVAVPPTTADVTVEALILFFINGKSYLLFALLIGLGFAWQLNRAEARGANVLPTYTRRLLLLFTIGILHAVFLWEGDILAMYAVLGFGLLLVRRWSSRALLAVVGVLLILSPVAEWISYTRSYGAENWANVSAAGSSTEVASTPADRAQAVYGHGRYLDMVIYRLETLPDHAVRLWLNQAMGAFAVFVFGLYAGRHRFIESVATYATHWRAWTPWVLAAALAVNLIYVVAFMQGRVRLELLSLTLGGPLLCLVYVGGLGLLLEKTVWRARLAPMAAIGRLSLTNYLFQSAVCTTIFYGYGFGMYGRIDTTTGFIIALAVFAFQIVISTWWLRRFQFGPIEWLSRTFIYGRWQTLRKSVPE